MSDVMLHGVLNMPPEIWSDSEIDKMQRYQRYVQASKKIYDLTEALQQAEMDMGVIWMALPPKERETLRIARDRILRVLES